MHVPARFVAAIIAGTVGLAACGETPATSATPVPSAQASQVTTSSPAGDLRTKLDVLLGEHLMLATKATGAALGGRTAEFHAYADLLNKNGTDLGAMITAAYGADAGNTFNSLWSAHNGLFVDYTTAVATGNAAAKQKAVDSLGTQYITPFAKFLSDATGLDKAAVTGLLTDHVQMTAAIVDAQAAKKWTDVYAGIRAGYAHMFKIGDALAPAIASKTGKFAGDASSKAVSLRVALDELLQEHLYLASDATGSALAGRNDEFAAAGAALNANGTDLGNAIGGLFGSPAKDQFNTIWSAHNGFFVDYTTAVAKHDDAAKQKAVNNLTQQYVPQFGQFLAGPTGIEASALSSAVAMHVTGTAAIVDAQAAGSYPDAATKDREAAAHMIVIGDTLAAGIAATNPTLVS